MVCFYFASAAGRVAFQIPRVLPSQTRPWYLWASRAGHSAGWLGRLLPAVPTPGAEANPTPEPKARKAQRMLVCGCILVCHDATAAFRCVLASRGEAHTMDSRSLSGDWGMSMSSSLWL